MDEAELAWIAHPVKRRPEQAALIAAVVLVTMWVVLVTLESLFLSVLAAIILLVSVGPFLLPTRYRLTATGVEERRLVQRRFRAWKDLRRVEVGPGAALVSPFARRSWMDRYRGVMLYLDGLDPAARDQVVATLRRRVAPVTPPTPPTPEPEP